MLAALRTRMLELARDRAHGAHPYLVTPTHTARARAGARRRARCWPRSRASFSRPTRCRPARSPASTWAATCSCPNYTRSWREDGFGDEDLADGGSDRLVDALIAWGDPDAIAERVRSHLEAGADHVAIQPVTADLDRARAELRTLAPALLRV